MSAMKRTILYKKVLCSFKKRIFLATNIDCNSMCTKCTYDVILKIEQLLVNKEIVKYAVLIV